MLSCKIYINGRFLCQKVTGVQRYAYETLRFLDQLTLSLANYTFTILTPSTFSCNSSFQLKNINIQSIGKLSGHLWEQIELPYYSRDGVLVNFCNTGPLIKSNQLVTIHDASVFGMPNAYSFLFRTWYKMLLSGLGSMTKRVITVSFFSKNELIKYCRINENKISVTTEGYEHILKTPSNNSILIKHNLVNKKYLLATSSLNPNKNFNSVIQAIKICKTNGFEFVIAGGANSKVFSIDGTQEIGNAKHVGYVSDEELRALYENAACFIYPSFYEGFGLPPLEAMACGCPVIVSNTSSLPEVCGDAVIYCDPYSVEDIAAKIDLVMTQDQLRMELKNRGLSRAANFTWEKCAREVLAQILEVIKR